jgi:hypothetical protein
MEIVDQRPEEAARRPTSARRCNSRLRELPTTLENPETTHIRRN